MKTHPTRLQDSLTAIISGSNQSMSFLRRNDVENKEPSETTFSWASSGMPSQA